MKQWESAAGAMLSLQRKSEMTLTGMTRGDSRQGINLTEQVNWDEVEKRAGERAMRRTAAQSCHPRRWIPPPPTATTRRISISQSWFQKLRTLRQPPILWWRSRAGCWRRPWTTPPCPLCPPSPDFTRRLSVGQSTAQTTATWSESFTHGQFVKLSRFTLVIDKSLFQSEPNINWVVKPGHVISARMQNTHPPYLLKLGVDENMGVDHWHSNIFIQVYLFVNSNVLPRLNL